jgi:hypothetical protein
MHIHFRIINDYDTKKMFSFARRNLEIIKKEDNKCTNYITDCMNKKANALTLEFWGKFNKNF